MKSNKNTHLSNLKSLYFLFQTLIFPIEAPNFFFIRNIYIIDIRTDCISKQCNEVKILDLLVLNSFMLKFDAYYFKYIFYTYL